jgi:hypothetical protein
MHPRTFTRAASVSPPYEIAPARFAHVPHTTVHQERRASARRGPRIAPARTIPRTSAHDRRTQRQERRASARRGFVNRVRNGNAVDFGASNPHAECIPRGAYAPALVAVRTFAGKKRFLRYTYAHPVRSGGRQPAVAHETHLPCSSIYFWQTTPPAKTAVRPPRFDQLNAACGVSETHMRERFVLHGRLTPTALGRDDG